LKKGICQTFDATELHITQSIDKLLLQLDSVIKELVPHGVKQDTVSMLNAIKRDTLKSKNEMIKKFVQKRECN